MNYAVEMINQLVKATWTFIKMSPALLVGAVMLTFAPIFTLGAMCAFGGACVVYNWFMNEE